VNLPLLLVPQVAALRALGSFGATDLVLFLGFSLSWSLAEYFIHRQILHGSLFRGTSIQQQHLAHHRYFTHRFMMLERAVDVNRVALFTSHLLMVLLLIVTLSAGLAFLFAPRTGLLFLSAGLLHVFLYEFAHATSHVQVLSSIPGLRKLAHHHRTHHDPVLATRANFATTFPFWDAIWGTRWKGATHA
jgi:hypothetical protein